MSARRRLPALLLLGGTVLALGAAAWPWLHENLIAPLALTAWLFLRLFVLSVDQRLFWLALVGAVPVVLVRAFRRRRSESVPGTAAADPAARGHPIEVWRSLIEEAARGARRRRAFGWDGFVQLAVSLQALQRRIPGDYHLHDALRTGAVPLPPRVHAFLFPAAEPSPRGVARLPALARRLIGAPARALDRLSGRARAERLRTISELLDFLEESLEIPGHDDQRD